MYEGRKQTPTIYSEAIKALYGTADAARLFYDGISTFLVDKLNFQKNPYDSCVANKMVDGSQYTILWHVDDLQISHVDPKVVTSVIQALHK